MKRIYTLLSVILLLGLIVGVFGCSASVAPAPNQAGGPGVVTSTVTVTATAPAKTVTATAQPGASQKVITWNMQSAYPDVSSNFNNYAVTWAKWVEQATNGRLKIEIHPNGTFAKTGEMLTALSNGLFDVAHDYGGYYTSNVPECNIETGLPMSWNEAFEVYDAYYNRGILDLMREAYAEKNVFDLGVECDSGTWYHFGTNFMINSLDDIKGKKIRALGMYGEYVQALGGSPVNVGGGDLYMALKTGMVDGMIYGISALDSYKLAEVVKYYVVDPTLTPVAVAFPTINMKSWNALPDDIKNILLQNTRYLNGEGALRYKLDSYKTLTSASKTFGVNFINLSAADKKRALEACLPLWDKVAAMSPRCAKEVDIIKQQMKDYGRMQ